jgi:hypothetical protein
MFGLFEKSKAAVIDHWYALVPGFTSSSKDFYESIEKELKERQVPGLEIFHVDFAEGGIMSSKREYLRMTRERLVFDICSAPFGTAHFFSCRFAAEAQCGRIDKIHIPRHERGKSGFGILFGKFPK